MSPPDLTRSIIVPDVKETLIMLINNVSVFGTKDYSGNVQSVHAIQTDNAIYSFKNGLIAQIQSDTETLIFNYNNTVNHFMVTVVTKNTSYEMPSSYDTPNITFPNPSFTPADYRNIPDPLTGIVVNLQDTVTSRSIDDATLQLQYSDEQLGNRSNVMINLGGGQYYLSLPINDTTIDAYFDRSNLLRTVQQQSDALLDLTQSYPIVDICSQIPTSATVFCSLITNDMTKQIPEILNTASVYAAQIPIQSKSLATLSNFQVVILIPGEQIAIIILDSSDEIGFGSSGSQGSNDYLLNPTLLTRFSLQAGGSRGKCNEQTVAGNDTPDDRIIDIGKANTAINFRYETYVIKDQIDVYYKNQQVFSTSCVGTEGELSTIIVLNDSESSVRVNVIPDCAGETGTAWYYTIECSSQELICRDDSCSCGIQGTASTQVKSPVANGCGSAGGFVTWFSKPIGEYWKLTPACDDHDRCYGGCNSSKVVCDQQFSQSMLDSCHVNWMNAADIQACENRANILYQAVNLLGSGSFDDYQQEYCACVTSRR